jgi:SSS family solute:Na+ symporter
MSHLPTIDVLVIVAFLAALVGVGLWSGGKKTTTDEFMAASRSLPGWAIGLSMFGSYISSLSFLGNSGKAFDSNWNFFVFTLVMPIAAAIAVFWLVPFYRRTGEVSAYEHLEHRFGPWARTYAVICFLLIQMSRTGAIVYLLAIAFSPLTGWDVRVTILVMGAAMTVYTLLGGIVAVVWTGVLQSAVLVAGTLICLFAVILKTPGGVSEIVSAGTAAGKFSLGSFEPSLYQLPSSQSTFWVILIYGLVMNLGNFATDQSYIQRYITARDDREAKKGVWLTALLYVPVAAIFFFIGTALFVFYQEQPQLLASGIKGDRVLPQFISTQLAGGLAGVVVSAVFAAAMDPNLNSMATLTYCDIYQRYFRPQASDREGILVLRFATLAWGAICTLVGIAMIYAGNILDAWWKLSGLFSGGVLGLFLLGFFGRRVTSRVAAVAVTIQVLAILWATVSQTGYWPAAWESSRNPLDPLLTVVLAMLVVLVAGSVGGLFSKSANAATR